MTAAQLADQNYERAIAERDFAIDAWLDAAIRLYAAQQLAHAKFKELGAAEKVNDRLRRQLREVTTGEREAETEWLR